MPTDHKSADGAVERGFGGEMDRGAGYACKGIWLITLMIIDYEVNN